MRDKASKHFDCTGRDRALFEAGIKMGAAYHQFVGTPLSVRNTRELERAIAESIKVQPFVVDAEASIDRKRAKLGKSIYGYTALSGDLLTLRVTVECEGWRVRAGMRHFDEIDYPLMYVESVSPVRRRRR